MTTLTEVLDLVAPAAGVHHGQTASVAWVRVLRARVPALDALDPGDLVIVPEAALAVVAPTVAEVRDLVEQLARSGAAGLLLVPASGAPAEGSPALLVEAETVAAAGGVPTVRAADHDPAALERRIIGLLVDRRGELERQAAGLERDLARLAMAGGGLEALAAAIGAFLRRAVAIEGPRANALAVHAPVDVPDAASAVAGYLARPTAAGRRIALPGAPGEAMPAGWLVLLGDRPASDLDTIAAERVAPLLSLELVLEAQVGRARDEAGRADALPPDGPPWVVLVARQPEPAAGAPAREAVRQELRVRFSARRLSLRGTSQSLELRAVVVPEADDPLGLRAATVMAGLAGRTVAVSRPFDDPAARPVHEAQARSTLEAVERLGEPPAVARADRQPAYRLLAGLGNLPDGRTQAAALLEPVLGGRPAVVRDRLATLRAVLDHGSAGEAAARLGVHRNTLAYRVRGIERRTGWDLGDPELRLALAIAVRLVQSEQETAT
jgi:hypothetical protein